MSGVFGTFGFKTEAVTGTAETTVDQFLPVLSAGFQRQEDKLQSMGLRGRQFAGCIKQGPVTWTGSFESELFGVGIATLLRHLFGDVTTTGAGPTYTHDYVAGSLGDLAFTSEVALPNGDGTLYGLKLAGSKFADWSLSVNTGELAKFGGSITSQSGVTGGTPASASYADSCPFSFVEATVEADDVVIAEAESMTVNVNNGLRTDSFRLGSQDIRNQSHNAFRTVNGSIDLEFEDFTYVDIINSGADVKLELLFDNGADTLAIVMPTCKLMGDYPELSGPDVLKQSLNFMAYSEPSDATVITASLVNTESTAV